MSSISLCSEVDLELLICVPPTPGYWDYMYTNLFLYMNYPSAIAIKPYLQLLVKLFYRPPSLTSCKVREIQVLVYYIKTSPFRDNIFLTGSKAQESMV